MRLFRTILVLTVVSYSNVLYSQTIDTISFQDDIAVIARASVDSITLRWAPRNFKTWAIGIRHGYSIERFTIVRNNSVLVTPEKKTLTDQPLRHESLDNWESLVKVDKYAAIAAQAMFGEDFAVNIEQSDVISIANQVTENEQRFAFALFAADLSPPTAKKSGLWFSDTSAKVDEKYLYRIAMKGDSVNSQGGVFVGTADSIRLPSPRYLDVEGSGSQVNLRWRQIDLPIYAWYAIERSTDSISFQRVGDVPVVTLSPTSTSNTKYLYAADSIPDVQEPYYYRIRGVTPFGEVGPPSEIARLNLDNQVFKAPYILNAVSIDNSSISITWEFPELQKIRGFIVERSSSDAGPFVNLTTQTPLSPQMREFTDFRSLPVNYYRVSAVGNDNTNQMSPTFLAILIDSIPPSAPQNLQAVIDDDGVLTLGWQKNSEVDLDGYRIYKSNHISEEASQITNESVRVNTFTERIDLRTLNRFVYYSVMAIDRNQNHSSLSSILKVKLPDKITPTSPTMLPLQVDDSTGIQISWIKSSSQDVNRYEIYRADQKNDQWMRIRIHNPFVDSALVYKDTPREPGKYKYTIVATDSSGNESEKAAPITTMFRRKVLLDPVLWKQPKISTDTNSVDIYWDCELQNIHAFKLYKSIGDQEFSLLKTLPGNVREYTDRLVKGQSFRYKILVISKEGHKSKLSEILDIKF